MSPNATIMARQQGKKVFLVINKRAGHHKNTGQTTNEAVAFLKQNGCHVEYAFTQHGGHAERLTAEALRKGFELIVAMGGDGTVNEVARSLIGTHGTMGIIPAGSGNGLARELGISMNPKKSIRTLLSGKIREIDVCRVNNQPFLCTCGIGFDAQIASGIKNASSRGFFRYIILTIRESIRFKPFSIQMQVDGQPCNRKAFMVTFANISQFGNHACIAPKAKINDGLLDLIIIRPFPKIWLPVLGILLFTPAIPLLPFVEHRKIKKAEILRADTTHYHYDGEADQLTFPAVIGVDRAKLSVVS
jgi:diacylglycerol kinase (ATP)